jgi:hypothetical protein
MSKSKWNEEEVEILEDCLRCGYTPSDISEELEGHGYDRSAEAVRRKISRDGMSKSFERVSPGPEMDMEEVSLQEIISEEGDISNTMLLGAVITAVERMFDEKFDSFMESFMSALGTAPSSEDEGCSCGNCSCNGGEEDNYVDDYAYEGPVEGFISLEEHLEEEKETFEPLDGICRDCNCSQCSPTLKMKKGKE